MDALERALRARIPNGEAVTRVRVALSGGLDSTVLLHALATARASGALSMLAAIHVHHGLQAAAEDWARRCGALCESLGVELDLYRVRVDPRDPAGPESAARRLRYEAFARALAPGEVLATAHHRDDQAETFLIRALRGSGVEGLGAMRPWRRFAAGWLWRPFLQLPRALIEHHARERNLVWIEDPHNADSRFLRSWLRGSVMPELARRLPGAAENLARSAALSAEASDLLDELAALDLADLADGPALSVAGLLRRSPARAVNAVRLWLRRLGLPAPRSAVLCRLRPELLEAASDRSPKLAWPGAELRRYRDRLFAGLPLPPAPGAAEIPWTGAHSPALPPGCGRLLGGAPARADGAWSVRFGVAGERFRPSGSPATRSLKNLFQEAGVPPWVRRRTPMLYRQGQLRWVGGFGWQGGSEAFELRWEPEPWRPAPPRADDWAYD